LADDSRWLVQDILDRSTALKAQGNAEFGKGQFETAMATYREGLVELPVRTRPAVAASAKEKEVEDVEVKEDEPKEEKVLQKLEELNLESSKQETQEAESEEAEMKELNELRSILFANVAACCIKLVNVHLHLLALATLLTSLVNRSVGRKRFRPATMVRSLRRSLLALVLTLHDYPSSRGQPTLHQSAATTRHGQRIHQ